VPTRDRRSLQEAIEASGPGKAVISLFVLVTIVAIATINLPESQTKRSLSKLTQPYANAIGIDQAWGVFAPDPRQESIELEAEITYPDGGQESWRAPERDAVIGTYSDYRWRKLTENAIVQGDGPIARQLALWVVRHERKRTERPSGVVLIKHSRKTLPPGTVSPSPPTDQENRFLELTPQDLRRAR